ncbi:MAG TPA: HAMP domain-containing sensor histidine kinase [Thermoanaerobaculia bacterium]|nr:HAMP domain-containing sensor histidine kinase [Thermoanaerobaculia bacterium]
MDPLLDSAPCGFVSVADDGTIIDINTTLASLLGYTRAELRGWHLQKILPPGGRIFYQTHVFPMLRMHAIVEELYLPLSTRDGQSIPMLMNAIRRERDRAFVSDCVFVRMIQRNEYESQLLQARRLAEQASAAKEKFLSMVSHDLRTPLTAITGNVALVAAGVHGPVTEEQRDALQRVRNAATELLHMLEDILGFAQLESGRVPVRPKDVNVRDAVARAEVLVRVLMEESGLIFEVDCDGAMVHADPDRLQQVLLNLLSNAIKFTPGGGRVCVRCAIDGERALIRVEDNGIGIPADQLQRIFEPFVQLDTEKRERGVGLGLAISRELARAMGGELTAESTPGSGAAFILELPAR